MRKLLLAVLSADLLTAASLAPENAELLRQVNAARAEPRVCAGKKMAAAPALTWSDAIEKAAIAHNKDLDLVPMEGARPHQGSDGSMPWDRLKRQGYAGASFGEILWHSVSATKPTPISTIKTAVQSWVTDPAHCAILMDSKFSDIGASAGVAKRVVNGDNAYEAYWTVDLAKPR